jgi:hypothetical protein
MLDIAVLVVPPCGELRSNRRCDEVKIIFSSSARWISFFGGSCAERKSDKVITAFTTCGRPSVVTIGFSEAGSDDEVVSLVSMVGVGTGLDSGSDIKGILPLPPAPELRASSASRKRVGNVLPRFSALRKIPFAALGLKKNLCGAWSSKTSDNEQTRTSLGDTEKLAIEHTPAKAIPAFDHENAEDFCKVSATVRTE